MASEIITSVQNPKIKSLKKLEKAGGRKEEDLFLIEGLREVVLASRAGYRFDSLFVCEELFEVPEQYSLEELKALNPKLKTYAVSKAVYDTLAYRETTEGVVATVHPREHSLENLELSKAPLVLVIEAVEKPGNLGAMLRTADAAGVDAVIICDPKTDVYNPNVIRSSIGTIFTNRIGISDTKGVIEYLQANKIAIFAAELNAEKFYYEQDFKKATAIVVGTEATGLSDEWIKAAGERIKIPMLGEIDSLNVSASAAILLFEAVRQRTIPPPTS